MRVFLSLIILMCLSAPVAATHIIQVPTVCMTTMEFEVQKRKREMARTNLAMNMQKNAIYELWQSPKDDQFALVIVLPDKRHVCIVSAGYGWHEAPKTTKTLGPTL